ncbi:BTAD domain-containing putative transcriptional regulator [Microbacterium sp. B2969]|uniref:BTAD domain-containing putative transcriptional regulator n=1 Tax=Microbacterium alkaliflavum TaxID=3248839 RepID=A0ABW7QA78_9MICO
MTVAYMEPRQAAADVVYLLGNPSVMQDGRLYLVPEGCKRVLAFVALQRGRVDRRHAAGSLWPEGSEDRASGNLRSALWRLRGAGITVLESDKISIFLREHTTTDLDALCEWADRLIAGTAEEEDLHVPEWTTTVAELLPGWYDEWVIFERERIRQRMLHALEVLSCTLRCAGRYGEAIDAAMDAVAVEPLRESAHRVLAEAHVAEGNYIEARRSYIRYRDIARRELGVEPSAAFRAWVQSCGSSQPAPQR